MPYVKKYLKHSSIFLSPNGVVYQIFWCRYMKSVNQGYSYCKPQTFSAKRFIIVEKCRVNTVLKQSRMIRHQSLSSDWSLSPLEYCYAGPRWVYIRAQVVRYGLLQDTRLIRTWQRISRQLDMSCQWASCDVSCLACFFRQYPPDNNAIMR